MDLSYTLEDTSQRGTLLSLKFLEVYMNDHFWVELALAFSPSINDISHTLCFAIKLWLLRRFTINPTSR